MRDALRGLHRIAPGIKYLGSYPRADRQPTVAPRIHSENSFDAAHAWVESLFPGGRPAHLKRGKTASIEINNIDKARLKPEFKF